MELTKEERIKIYNNIIKILTENKKRLETRELFEVSPYLCDNLVGQIREEHKIFTNIEDLGEYFPEVSLFEPVEHYGLGWWEDRTEIEPRILVLEFCIEICKNS